MENSKIFVFGIDGGTWDIILPAIKSGKLPNLQYLIERGASGPLHSTIHPITPMAWSSFATGMNAGKHGIFDFSHSQGEELILNTAHDRKAPAIWTHLTHANKASIVLNVPFTYPPERIKGIMIPGFDAPMIDRGIFHPESIYDELTTKFGDYHLDWTFPIGKKFDPEKYLQEVEQVIAHRGDTGLHLLKNHPWEFFMIVFTSTDHVQHVFWKYPGGREIIERVYQEVDYQLGRFLDVLSDDATIFIMSDHGAGGIDLIVNLDNWLAEEGYFHRPRFSLKHSSLQSIKSNIRKILPIDLRKKLRHRFSGIRNRMEGTLQNADVDWSKTKAYSYGMYGNICINLKGRETSGIVPPEDYERLLSEISEKILRLEDPNTGKCMVERICRKEELYTGPYIDDAPDLIIQWRDYAYFTKKGIDQGVDVFSENLMIDASEYPHTGTHRLEGIYVAKGPNINKAQKTSARIIDLAPTILQLLGVTCPENLDGRVLNELFEEFNSKRIPSGIKNEEVESSLDLKEEIELTDEVEQSIKERLRSLGYI